MLNEWACCFNAQMIVIGATADTAYSDDAALISTMQAQLGIALYTGDPAEIMAFVAQKGMPGKAAYVSEYASSPDLYYNVQVQGGLLL